MTTIKRDDIQILRAIAIIAVVLIHTCPDGMYQVWCRPFINFAVGLFLFLSGYLTKTHYDSWMAFFKRRVTRVVIPYLIWSIIYSLSSNPDPILLLKNIITSNATAHLYYIPVYVQFVLLTPLIIRLAKSRYRNIGWIISPVSLLLFCYPQLYTGRVINGYLSMACDISCLNWFTFYYLGIVLGNDIISRNHRARNIGLLLLVSIIPQFIEGYILHELGANNCGTQLKITSLLTSSLTCIMAYNMLRARKIQINNHLLLTIGKYSFGIYLCHILFLRILKGFAFYQHIPYVINSAIILMLSVLLCIICDRVLSPRMLKWIGIR
jgi:peptidoglycan/LPS O-acetylase OafA/YrhL